MYVIYVIILFHYWLKAIQTIILPLQGHQYCLPTEQGNENYSKIKLEYLQTRHTKRNKH